MSQVTISKADKGWAKFPKLDGATVEFAEVPKDATPESAVSFVRGICKTDSAFVGFLRGSVERAGRSALKTYLNGKDVAKGASKEDRKNAKRRGETMSKEDVAKFGATFQIGEPRVGIKSRLVAVEAEARRNAEQKAAAVEGIVGLLKDLNPKLRAERIASFKVAGILPADFELPAA